MRFDRRLSPALMDALRPGGWLHGLVERRHARPDLLDLQARRDGSRAWVSVYAGLSAVLSVEEQAGRLRLRSHPSYRALGGFGDGWDGWRSEADVAGEGPAVEAYLDTVLADRSILPRYVRREGLVHSLLCAGVTPGLRVIQREATFGFPSADGKADVTAPFEALILDAVRAAGRQEAWWPGVRDHGVMPQLGTEADLLGVDDDGRLLVIEVKPADEVKGITWAPAQVAMYALLFRRFLDEVDGAVDVLNEMLGQRVELGLTAAGGPLHDGPRVVPVVAVGAGQLSPAALPRFADVWGAVRPAVKRPMVDPLELWLLDEDGGLADCIVPARAPATFGATVALAKAAVPPPTFVDAAREAATAWKGATATLPGSARPAAAYRGKGAHSFCLPEAFSHLNLLPEACATALDRFAAAGIAWHDGIGHGPSNHLLSSQVQCVNTLAPFVDDPAALARLFGGALPIAEVLPFGATTGHAADTSDHVVFEWIGAADHLGERAGGPGTRGAHTTSADAAIRYRTTDGRTEIALIEWKYTERYQGHELSGGERRQAVRRARYQRFWDDPASPVRTDVLPYEDLFVEPFYQLFRLQLLAWRMELAGEGGADAVRVLYVAPSLNQALATSFNRPSHRGDMLGQPAPTASVFGTWRRALRRPDRFALLDSAALVAPSSPVSAEYRSRYGHLAVCAPGFAPNEDPAARLAAAAARALKVLERVSSDGGVLQGLLGLDEESLRRADPLVVDATAARLEEIAELVRRFRADQLTSLLWPLEPAPA